MWKRTLVIMKNLNLLILRCFVIVFSAYSDLDHYLALSIIKFLKLRDHTNSKTDLVVKKWSTLSLHLVRKTKCQSSNRLSRKFPKIGRLSLKNSQCSLLMWPGPESFPSRLHRVATKYHTRNTTLGFPRQRNRLLPQSSMSSGPCYLCLMALWLSPIHISLRWPWAQLQLCELLQKDRFRALREPTDQESIVRTESSSLAPNGPFRISISKRASDLG